MTPAERYRANLSRVATKNADFAQQLDGQPLTNIALFPAGQEPGAWAGAVWDCPQQGFIPLCNPATPQAEAEAMAEQMYTPHARVFCLLGLGLGQFAVEFAKRLRPYQRLGIFEPNICVYKAAMHVADLSWLLGAEDKRVDTHLGDNLVQQLQHWFLTFDSQEKLHMHTPMASGYTNHTQREVYGPLTTMAEDMLRFHTVGVLTWQAFGGNIAENDLRNLPELLITPSVATLRNTWHGKPAVCIAAGPSLQKNLAVLVHPAVRNKVLVIANGQMYAPMKALGITPDIVTAIDFQRLTWTDQFADFPLDRETALVYLHSTHPATVRKWPGPKFVALNSSDTVGWIRQTVLQEHETYDASDVQTVAHLNLHVASLLGANPILLLGQDLSAPWNAHHAPGARSQDTAPEEHPEAWIQLPDYAGTPCWSRHSFLSMKLVFERLIAQRPHQTFVNCTEGGLALAGAPNQPFAATLDALPGDATAALAHWRRQVHYETQAVLARQASAVIDTAATVLTTAQQQFTRFAQWLKDAQAVADLAAVEAQNSVLQQELTLPFNHVVTRCFPALQLLAEIPPIDPDALQAHRVDVMQRLGALLEAPLTQAQTTLRQVLQRVNALRRARVGSREGTAPEELLGLLRQQFYSVARDRLHLVDDADRALWLRYWRMCARGQQVLSDLEALAAFPLPGHTRLHTCIAQLREQWQQTLAGVPAYYAVPPGTAPPVRALPALQAPSSDEECVA